MEAPKTSPSSVITRDKCEILMEMGRKTVFTARCSRRLWPRMFERSAKSPHCSNVWIVTPARSEMRCFPFRGLYHRSEDSRGLWRTAVMMCHTCTGRRPNEPMGKSCQQFGTGIQGDDFLYHHHRRSPYCRPQATSEDAPLTGRAERRGMLKESNSKTATMFELRVCFSEAESCSPIFGSLPTSMLTWSLKIQWPGCRVKYHVSLNS